jgi:ParB family chromosome partitioning protein
LSPETAATGRGRTTKGRRPGGRKTQSRFAGLAGGEASTDVFDATDEAVDDGIVGGLASRARTVEGHAVVEIDVSRIAPHPYNDPRRSQPQPGNPKWDELVNGVRANGVKVPGLLVTRQAFLDRRPEAEELVGQADYIAIYGHRRRAALIAAARTMLPCVIDDSVMEDDGDLDQMTLENLGREDLSELAEARLFARYSEQLGLGQRAIADKLGVDQGTVSRRLALLLLCPEAQEALERKDLPGAAAAALAGALPYGPPRGWQKSPDPEQASAARRADQVAALSLMLAENMTPARAAERIVSERQSRARAAADGLKLVDPVEEFGKQQTQHRLYNEEQVEAARSAGHLVAAIDPGQGTLAYYSSQAAVADAAATQTEELGRQRKAASDGRRESCLKLATTPAGRDALLEILVIQRLLGEEKQPGEVWKLAHQWAKAAGIDPPEDMTEFRAAPHHTASQKDRSHLAWILAIARFEISAQSSADWGPSEVLYLELLTSRVGHQPSPWEQRQLEHAVTRT